MNKNFYCGMNKLEVRWVIISVLFAFLPLTLLLEPSGVVSQLHPVFDLFKDPTLFFVYSQLAILGLNFILMGAKAVAFKFYRVRTVVSVLLMILAFVPVYLAGNYSVALTQEFLPESPLPFIVGRRPELPDRDQEDRCHVSRPDRHRV